MSVSELVCVLFAGCFCRNLNFILKCLWNPFYCFFFFRINHQSFLSNVLVALFTFYQAHITRFLQWEKNSWHSGAVRLQNDKNALQRPYLLLGMVKQFILYTKPVWTGSQVQLSDPVETGGKDYQWIKTYFFVLSHKKQTQSKHFQNVVYRKKNT